MKTKNNNKTALLNESSNFATLILNTFQNSRGTLSFHVLWGWHFAVGCCRWRLRSLLWSWTSLVSGSGWSGSEVGRHGSSMLGLLPKFGWSFRLQSCWSNRLLSLFKEAADDGRISLWPTTGYQAKIFELSRGQQMFSVYFFKWRPYSLFSKFDSKVIFSVF